MAPELAAERTALIKAAAERTAAKKPVPGSAPEETAALSARRQEARQRGGAWQGSSLEQAADSLDGVPSGRTAVVLESLEEAA